MTALALVDGAVVAAEDAKISILDWGFLRSDACQDTVSVWSGQFFRLADHIARFRRSCGLLRLEIPYDDAGLTAALGGLVAASGLREAYVQMLVTRGRPAPGSRDPRSCRNRFFAFCLPYVWISPKDGPGLRLKVSDRPRIDSASVSSEIKNYHWIDFELGLFEAFEADCDSVVLTDGAGHLTEGPGFNLFAVVDGTLISPDRNVLPGVTRRTVIELAEELQLTARLAPLTAADLARATEVFATSTAGGIMAVRSVDGRAVADGTPGPITRRLAELYWSRRAQGWHGTPVPYPAAED